MTVAAALFMAVGDWLVSADPIGASFFILGLTTLTTGGVWGFFRWIRIAIKKRRNRKNWPVRLSAAIARDNRSIDLAVSNRVESQPLTVVVTSTLGLGTEAPYTLPWVREAIEYRHVPSKVFDVVRLCTFHVIRGIAPAVEFTFPRLDGRPAQSFTMVPSTFWTGDAAMAKESVLLNVVVAGRETGYLKDFRIVLELNARITTPQRMALTVDIDARNGRSARSYSLLFDDELSYGKEEQAEEEARPEA